MPITVLITGFEPFGGSTTNPSELLIEQLKIFDTPDLKLVTTVLPVEFTRASELLLKLIRDVEPDAVIALGQAEGRSHICIERIAINLADAKMNDNAEVKFTNQKILLDGAAGYFTTLPVQELVIAVNNAGIKCSQSLTAGSFVCNYIFYRMQHELKDTKVISGFIHLPLVPMQQSEFPNLPTMPLSDMVNAIKIIILKLGSAIT